MKRHQPRYKYILSVETANVLNITGELDFGNTLIFSHKHRAAFKLKEWNIDLKKQP